MDTTSRERACISRVPATYINVIIKPIRRLGIAHRRRLVYNLLTKRLLVVVHSLRQLRRSFAPSLDRTRKHKAQPTGHLGDIRLSSNWSGGKVAGMEGRPIRPRPDWQNVLSERIMSCQNQPAQRTGFYGFYAKTVSPAATDIKN